MCQATAYLDQDKLMEDVIWLEPTADGFRMRTFFGEPLQVKAKLEGIDLLKHRILLTSTDSSEKGTDQ